jgi:hypothetical protein
MKKYLLGLMLLLSTMSFNVFSGQQICFPTAPGFWFCIEYYTPGNLGAFGPPANTVNNGMTTNSTTHTVESKAKEDAAKAAAKVAEAKAIKRWCIENGFPKTSDNACEKVQAACDSMKVGAPIDRQSCVADVNYRGGILMDTQCGSSSPTNVAGTFSWNYSFIGKFYSFSANIPAQSYNEFSIVNSKTQCEGIVADAVNYIASNCDTQAEYAVHEKCEY